MRGIFLNIEGKIQKVIKKRDEILYILQRENLEGLLKGGGGGEA